MFRSHLLRAALLPLVALLGLAACGGPQPDVTRAVQAPAPAVVALYQPVVDGEYVIPGVHPGYLTGRNGRTTVEWTGSERPGTIIVDPHARVLYHVHEGGVATRYGIAVGREGYGFRGSATVGRKAEWPGWTPTANMIRREPEVYAQFAGGMAGGLDNPLGARALYLYRGSRDTMYRIHGTNSVSSIGRATSAGCIRLFNQDIIHLYNQVRPGAPVRVRSLAESIAAEGRMIEGPTGLMVPVDSAQGQAILAGQVEVPIIN